MMQRRKNFKEMTRLNKQREKLEGLLSEVNAFNAKAKAAEIGKVLDKYIPSVEKMSTQVRKYSKVFGSMKAENAALELANFLHLSHKLKAYYEIFTLSNDKVDFILCKIYTTHSALQLHVIYLEHTFLHPQGYSPFCFCCSVFLPPMNAS